MILNLEQVNQLIERQLRDWSTVSNNYAALHRVQLRDFNLNEHSHIVLQFNPERRRSSGARIDAASIAARKCFLCSENQPVEQEAIEWGGRYKIQVNPYPIFPRHLTISALNHMPQAMEGRIDHMLSLAAQLPDFVLFYNGPRCGASAPDHMHFQAGNKGFMPLCDELRNPALHFDQLDQLDLPDGTCRYTSELGRRLFLITSASAEVAAHCYRLLLDAMGQAMEPGSHDEPMHNILCWHDARLHRMVVFPRAKHRPSCYGDGDGKLLVSPASVDLGGVWAIAVESDFNSITREQVQSIYDELCIDEAMATKIKQIFKVIL